MRKMAGNGSVRISPRPSNAAPAAKSIIYAAGKILILNF